MYRGRLPRTLAVVAILSVAACALSAGGPPPVGPSAPAVAAPAVVEEFGPPRPDPTTLELAWVKSLPPLEVECANTGAKTEVHLYDPDGRVDAGAVGEFSRVAADSNGEFPLHDRLVQLAVKAAHHFGSSSLVVVSGYRKARPRSPGDHHSKGEALDFRLPGIDYRKLAGYLRSLPRVGVGVYTDPRTHYVHLDVRDRSFHWLDASPPGVTWREAAIPDAMQATRDAAYTLESDLPLDAPK